MGRPKDNHLVKNRYGSSYTDKFCFNCHEIVFQEISTVKAEIYSDLSTKQPHRRIRATPSTATEILY